MASDRGPCAAPSSGHGLGCAQALPVLCPSAALHHHRDFARAGKQSRVTILYSGGLTPSQAHSKSRHVSSTTLLIPDAIVARIDCQCGLFKAKTCTVAFLSNLSKQLPTATSTFPATVIRQSSCPAFPLPEAGEPFTHAVVDGLSCMMPGISQGQAQPERFSETFTGHVHRS